MKAEVDRDVVGRTVTVMVTILFAEDEDRYNGKENRHHDRDGTAGS